MIDRDPHERAFLAREQRRGFVGRQLGGRPAVDRDDAVAVDNARLMGRAAGDDVHDQQGAVVGLELDAQAHKVAFDLLINFPQLVGGEIGRVLVEPARRGGDEFQQGGRLPQAAADFDDPSRFGCQRRKIIGPGDRSLATSWYSSCRTGVELLGRKVQAVAGVERRVEQREIERRHAASGQPLPGGVVT